MNRSYKMVLREGFQPVGQPARRVPIALREPLRAELNRLVEAEIVRRVQQPNDWARGLVMAHKKNGQLRVCLDPRHINAILQGERFTLPNAKKYKQSLPALPISQLLMQILSSIKYHSMKPQPQFARLQHPLGGISTHACHSESVRHPRCFKE